MKQTSTQPIYTKKVKHKFNKASPLDPRRLLPKEIWEPLLEAFNDQIPLLQQLVEYALNEVRNRQLVLSNCPDIPPTAVCLAISKLAESNAALDQIRESGDLVIIRVAIELLHRIGNLIYINTKDQLIRRCVCALVEVVLINMANPQLYYGHVFLFTRSLRALVCDHKLPLPSLIRMQQAEYLLDPLSSRLYLEFPHNVNRRNFHERLASKSKRRDELLMDIVQIRVHLNNNNGHSIMLKMVILWSTEQLKAKYLELQGDPVKRLADIRSKARVFEIVTRMIQRLFGVSPYLFGR